MEGFGEGGEGKERSRKEDGGRGVERERGKTREY